MMWCMHVRGLTPGPFVYWLCLAHQLLFSSQEPVHSLTTANQGKKFRIVFKFQLCVGVTGYRKSVSVLPNGLNKSGVRAQDTRTNNSSVDEIRTHNL